jgi:putative flippase GtrA
MQRGRANPVLNHIVGQVRAEARQFIRFAVVGATGFAVDAIVLSIFHYAVGLDPFTARLISMSVATLTTWRLNRILTFGASHRSQAHEGLRYATVAALSAAINYVVYAAVLLIWPHVPPIGALVVGAGAGMGFSYIGYSRVVFGAPRAVFVSPSSQSR